jgi:hypothetical protein
MRHVSTVIFFAQRTLTLYTVIGLMLVLAFIAGCATTSDQTRTKTEGTAVGAGTGAAVGALLGYLLGGKDGAIIGASTGAVFLKPPIYSAWTTFHEREAELPGFGMYTYVLFGRDVTAITTEESLALKRYESLLKEIVKSWQYGSLPEFSKKEEVNLFCIPVKYSESKGQPTVSVYNFDLARLYLARVGGVLIAERETALRFLNKPGPFLVSTLLPIHKLESRKIHLLYTDLSDMNPSAMAEVINAYKQRVHGGNVESIESFRPFHLRLLSIILDASNNVGLVKDSISSWFPWGTTASAKEQKKEGLAQQFAPLAIQRESEIHGKMLDDKVDQIKMNKLVSSVALQVFSDLANLSKNTKIKEHHLSKEVILKIR